MKTTEQEIQIRSGQDDMPAFVAHPAIGDGYPLVVMLMDGAGIREGLKENARRLASNGYYVILPNLFHRSAGTGPIENLHDMERMTVLNTGLKNEDVTQDIVACADYADTQEAASGTDHFGLIGYCMGGRLTVTAAQALGDRVAAVASLHPGYMATRSETSPHLFLDSITAQIYFGIAEEDPHLSPGAVKRLQAALDENQVNYVLEVIPGTQHGFTVPGRESYSPNGSEHAWNCALDLFSQHLKAETKGPAGAKP